MSNKPMFSDDDEERPLMTEEELHDACLHSAATIVVAVALGAEFQDCLLDDDGFPWPCSVARVHLKYPKDWEKDEAISSVAAIHEAGAMAVAKHHGRAPHLVINNNAFPGDNQTRRLLDTPRVWETIEALARQIEESGDGRCLEAMGTEAGSIEDSAALKLIIGKLSGENVEPVPSMTH